MFIGGKGRVENWKRTQKNTKRRRKVEGILTIQTVGLQACTAKIYRVFSKYM